MLLPLSFGSLVFSIICSYVLMSKPFFCLKVELFSILLKKTQKYLDYSEGMFIFATSERKF